MKKIYVILIVVAVSIGGCSALVSVGDSNTNTISQTNNLNTKGE